MSDFKVYTCGRCGATLPSGRLGVCPQCKTRLIGVRPGEKPGKGCGLVASFIFVAIVGVLVWYFWPQVSGWFVGKWTDPFQGTWAIEDGEGERDGRPMSREEIRDFRVVIQGDRVEVRRLNASDPDYIFTMKQTTPPTLDSTQAQGDCGLEKEGYMLALRYARTGARLPQWDAPTQEGQARFLLKRLRK